MLIAVNYHYIRKDFSQPHPGIFGITPDNFENQLKTLAGYGKFISQETLASRIKNGEILNNQEIEFIITFDDGLKEQYDEALPILNRMGIPAVFYVNTSNFENNHFSLVHQIHLLRSQISAGHFLELLSSKNTVALLPDEKVKAHAHYRYDDPETAELKYTLNFKLSFEQQSEIINLEFPEYFKNPNQLHESFYMSHEHLKHLASLGYLGTHGVDHIPMGLYPANEIKRQIHDSKQYLETLCGKPIYGVSYPYGSLEACGGIVPLIAEEQGLVYGFSTERAGNFNLEKPLILARFNCNDVPGGKSNLFPDLKIEHVNHKVWSYPNQILDTE